MQFSLTLSTPVRDLVEISLPSFGSTYVKTAVLILKPRPRFTDNQKVIFKKMKTFTVVGKQAALEKLVTGKCKRFNSVVISIQKS